VKRPCGGHFRHLTQWSQQFLTLSHAYIGLYTKLGLFINNQRLMLADRAKQSKLQLLKSIDLVHSLDRPMSHSYRPAIEAINWLTRGLKTSS